VDILPVFITCDPARDDVNAVKTYVKGELGGLAAVALALSLTGSLQTSTLPSSVSLARTTTSRRPAKPSTCLKSYQCCVLATHEAVSSLSPAPAHRSRVYFSTPPNTKPGDDYLVDHSIFFYLMDPNGKFVDAFGRSMGAEDVTNKVRGYLDEWKEFGGKGSWTEAPAA
jgi:protein SCO1/2